MTLLKNLILISLSSIVVANGADYNYLKDIEMGKKYMEQNSSNLAIAAFERVLIYNPNNDEAKFYLGILYGKLGQKELALKCFRDIKQPTQQMQIEIENYLKTHKDRKLKLDLTILVGANIDTNIDNDSDAESWNIIEDDSTSKKIYNFKEKKIAASAYELITIDPVYTNKFQVHNNFTFYNKNVINNSDKDIQVFSYTPSLNMLYKNSFLFNHSLNYTYIRYGHNDLINRVGVGESLKFDFLKNHTSITNITFNYSHYLDSDIVADDYFNLKIDQKVIKHFKYNTNLLLKFGFENNYKKDDSQNITDYKSYKIGTGGDITFADYKVELLYDYQNKKYDKENPLFQKKQTDKQTDIQAIINRKGKYITYQTKVEYVDNISNIEPYSYKKWILSINFIKQFKGL